MARTFRHQPTGRPRDWPKGPRLAVVGERQTTEAGDASPVGLGTDVLPLLSARQLEVMRHKALGCTAPAIARELHIAVNTVRNHTAAAYAIAEAVCLVDFLRAIGWLVVPDDDAGHIH